MDNALSTYWYMLGKDCPGKVWWNARPTHPAIYRALGVAPDDHGAVYACAPFRIARIDGAAIILAALPAPKFFDEPDGDWLAIDAVVAWEPNADRATILGDDAAKMVSTLRDGANVLFSSPRQFFQRWAINRAQYLSRRQLAKQQRWNKAPAEVDETPGALVLTSVTDITWRPSELPEHIECQGINPQVVNKVIMRAARLPRATGGAL